ncbi:hypothetical protein LXL04_009788 [Taraxacum kok-saghyz]
MNCSPISGSIEFRSQDITMLFSDFHLLKKVDQVRRIFGVRSCSGIYGSLVERQDPKPFIPPLTFKPIDCSSKPPIDCFPADAIERQRKIRGRSESAWTDLLHRCSIVVFLLIHLHQRRLPAAPPASFCRQ